MRTIITTWVAVIATLFPTLAMGALPPTRVSGQSDALSTTFDFKTPYSQATKYSGTGSLLELDSYNVLKNPRFEATTYSSNWTASGGTVAAAATTNIFFSKGATWDSGSASQTFTSDAITVPEGFKGNNCEASMYIKVPSGTATHLIQAWDGTNILASQTISSVTYFAKNTVTFPCPTSGTIALRLISVASDEPLIALDEGYLGLARNVGVADLTTERKAWTPTGVWVSNATYTGFESRVGDTQHVWFRISLGGAPSGTLTMNIPSGCTIDTAKTTGNNARNPIGNLLIFDSDTGANIYGTVQAATTTSVALNVILTGNASTTPISNITATVPITFASGDTIDGYFAVPCVGWAASTVVMPDAQGWFVAGEITGANPTLGTAAVTSMTEITNGSLTLTPKANSAPVGITCATGTTSPVGGTTCDGFAVNESLGFVTNVPRSGEYEACFAFTISGATGNTVTLQASQTTASSSTPVQNGQQRTSFYDSSTSVAVGSTQRNCSFFTLSAGTNAFRLSYEQDAATNAPGIIADGNTSLGQRNFSFTLKPVSSQQQAILANSVSTGATNGINLESLRFTNNGATCAVVEASSNWYGAFTRNGTGRCSFAINSGVFSGQPHCTCAPQLTGAGGCGLDGSVAISTTNVGFRTQQGGVETDLATHVICTGPR